MEIQILKQEIKDVLRSDALLQGKLAAFNGVTVWAVGQWRLKNKDVLTTLDNLKIIRDHITQTTNPKFSFLRDRLIKDAMYELTEAVEVDENGNIIGANERGEIVRDVAHV